MRFRHRILATAAAAALSTPCVAASTGRYAPLGRPGPALSLSQSQITQALACNGNLADRTHKPILLVPGTATTPATAFSWNYENAFHAAGRPYCALTLPGNALSDIQIAGEYVVGAIRSIYAASGNHPLAIVGWSQGGMVPRWALRFWPDTRPMVASMIGLDPSNHGTLDAVALCDATQACAAAIWQQASNARFIAALNSGAETFAKIAYTTIYSRTDEVVFPNLTAAGASSLQTGAGMRANIAVQSVCPTDVDEHLAMGTYDPVGYALVVDALDRTTPANPADIPLSTCLEGVQPGVNRATFAANFAALDVSIAEAIAAAPDLRAEPPLASYVFR